MKKVIFDCDPGLDDGIALLIAFASPMLDIQAITTTFGCSTIENTTQNAINLVHFLNKTHVKIAKGASKSMSGISDIAPFVHGTTGFKNINIPHISKSPYEKCAIETMYEIVTESREKITFIATGPLTNLGMFLQKYSELKEKIECISIMGGAIGIGNKSPVAEANIFNDPIAAKIVFDSGIPIRMSGLQTTLNAYILDNEIEQIAQLGNKEAILASEFLKSHGEFYKKQNFIGDPPHDVNAVFSLIKPELYDIIHCHVDVETQGEFTIGETIVDLENKYGKEKNTHVSMHVHREKFVEAIKETLNLYNQK